MNAIDLPSSPRLRSRPAPAPVAGGTGATFSVVIPAFNQGRWLGSAIESVLEQEEPAREIIVVNDGSTDETAEVAARYRGRVRTIHQRNRGLSAARNRGAREASGDYVVYLDSDDLLFPWALRTLREAIDQDSLPALVLSRGRSFATETELAGVTRTPPRTDVWADYLASARASYWIGVTGAIRRDLLLKPGGFLTPAAGAEDHDFWMRIGTAPGFVYLNDPPVYAYRQHPGSITRRASAISSGICFLLDCERAGVYPGGRERERERRRLLAKLVCWGTRRCFQSGGFSEGYRLYRRGLKFLVGAGLSGQAVRLPALSVRDFLKQPYS